MDFSFGKNGVYKIEMIRNGKKRNWRKWMNLYKWPVPYIQKNTYPYVSKMYIPYWRKVQENNINIIEDLFNYIINNSEKISKEFYDILNRLEFIYTTDILSIMQDDKVQMLKWNHLYAILFI